ncbi:metallophosphoesterase [Alkalicoccus daliensis]|uniref:Predicted phosphohydrolase, MPP superfamily n=1 Tax=Alkalicoccus daliensis TaxID=745820 RepID=A0A1H0AX43_9BACI|nr:metallophosphoesterase [Alkalicoccus daliensis]SDN38030.1 Predicted phosphohydrolase, MPP superfamily [Alkalicoccus daliensis]
MKKVILGIFTACVSVFILMLRQAGNTSFKTHHIPFFTNSASVKLLFIADLHKRRINYRDFANAGEIELICLGGDLAEKSTRNKTIEHNLQILSAMAPIYFVWGNNDYEKKEVLQELFKKYGVIELNNDNIFFEAKGWTLAGVEDIKLLRDDTALSLAGSRGPVLLLSHNPEAVWKLPLIHNVKLVLSGHTHGGQIRLGPWGIDELGGLKERNKVLLLLSNGYGTTGLPLRFGARPELHIVHLLHHR